jgi:hypothetical protein
MIFDWWPKNVVTVKIADVGEWDGVTAELNKHDKGCSVNRALECKIYYYSHVDKSANTDQGIAWKLWPVRFIVACRFSIREFFLISSISSCEKLFVPSKKER